MRKLAFILPIFVAACSGQSASSGRLDISAAPVKIETNSPDATIKTWWKLRDQAIAHDLDECKRASSNYTKGDDYKAYKSVTTGPAALSADAQRCDLHIFDRVINEVKVESETRSVVLATIKAATPIPPGAKVTDFDSEHRAKGTSYKYVLTKVGNEWKIEQIYTLDSRLNGDEWTPVFDERPAPYVHSFVFGAQ
jgi:hypothetical protein